MGCVSSKDRLQKDHPDHYGFEQSYRQKDIQARHTTSTLPRVKTSTSTLPRVPTSRVERFEGTTLERRARATTTSSSQFDPHKDMVIQSLQFRSPHQEAVVGQFRSPPPEAGKFRSPAEGGGHYMTPNEAQYRGLAEGHARTLERRGGNGTSAAERKNQASNDDSRWQQNNNNSARRDRVEAITPTSRQEKKNNNNETPRRGGASASGDFDRNKFDRSSQLRRSKKKRKKSSLDQSLSPGAKSTTTRSEDSSPAVNKTPQGIVTEVSGSPAQQANTSVKSETTYDPKYGNLI